MWEYYGACNVKHNCVKVSMYDSNYIELPWRLLFDIVNILEYTVKRCIVKSIPEGFLQF
jgi:hypothetical protein